jgi:hypothetical protein
VLLEISEGIGALTQCAPVGSPNVGEQLHQSQLHAHHVYTHSDAWRSERRNMHTKRTAPLSFADSDVRRELHRVCYTLFPKALRYFMSIPLRDASAHSLSRDPALYIGILHMGSGATSLN